MAGANSLLTEQYPNDFQVITIYSSPSSTSNDPLPILYADRNIVIDSIVVGVRTPAPESGARVAFEVAGAPNSEASTEVVCTANIDTAETSAGDTFVFTTNRVIRTSSGGSSLPTPSSTPISSSVNLVEKGKWLVADFSAGNLTAFRLLIQVRFRSLVA